ncbi:MAG: family 20 glycosylhydrolase [Melioribacteraceae bacterium]|nr:family 20 glycosylhydrolase [Melioribacteraceae bacterium]
MKQLILLILLLGTVMTSAQQHTLTPVPSEFKFTQNKFAINDSLHIIVKGKPDNRIYSYATRVLRRLDERTAQFFYQEEVKPNDKNGNVIIEVERPGKVILGEDESYELTINNETVKIEAATDLGAIHGLETLLQLLRADENGYYFQGVELLDNPRFKWRGLMLDLCRHFIPMDVVLRNIDAISMFKMNVLHLHLTEDQGFRVECKTYPYLHKSGSDGNYYTHDDIKKIIKYANERGIRVIPEFDIPGHATSWFVANDELASAPGPYTIERKWGVFDPTFDPTKEETYTFFNGFFKEMAELFNDEYMHIGGDENNGKQWKANEEIQAYMKKNDIHDKHELQAYFNQRISKILTKYNKKMVGWDEIQHPDLPGNIVIHSWRGKQGIKKAAENGYNVMLSNGWYIDLMQSTKDQYLNDPLPEEFNNVENIDSLVLGGEATMWAENATTENIDSRIWPRTIAIAERLWSKQNINDFDDFLKRMEINSLILEELGSKHISYYDMMLRRLSGSANINPLKTFVDLVEPLKDYDRHGNFSKTHNDKRLTSYHPYTRVMDVAKPDPACAIRFDRLVEQYIDEPNKYNFEKLNEIFEMWIGNDKELQELISKRPILMEMKPMADNLKIVSELGKEIVSIISEIKIVDEDWKLKADEIIKRSYEPYGQVNLMIVPAIEKLVKAAKVL